MQELSRASLRRFGHSSRRYEELMESFHLQLSQLPDEVVSKMEAHRRALVHRNKEGEPIGNRRYSWISVPPALGPVALAGDKAYVPRFWPRELAVLDISDPRRPVEVGYLRGESPSQLVKRGKLVHSLAPWGGIRAYSVDQDGTLLTPTRWRRLQLEGRPQQKAPSQGSGTSGRITSAPSRTAASPSSGSPALTEGVLSRRYRDRCRREACPALGGVLRALATPRALNSQRPPPAAHRRPPLRCARVPPGRRRAGSIRGAASWSRGR